MRKFLLTCIWLTAAGLAHGEILEFDLSPAGSGLGRGLSPLNEVIATPSTGSGGEIGLGIIFDTLRRELTLNVGYGSASGFSDLTGPAFSWLLHGPSINTETAPAVFNLAALHTFALDHSQGGSFSGSLLYSEAQVSDLLAGLDYINIYTPANPGGEIRGHLVLVPEPSVLQFAAAGFVALLALGWRRSRSCR